MSESEVAGISLDDYTDPVTPPVAAEPVTLPDAVVPEDGVVQVAEQRINVGPMMAAERKRVREATEARVRAEYEPLRQQASVVSQMQAEIAALKAQLPAKQAEPAVPEVTDADADTYARRHQLFDAEGKADIRTSKSILSEQRADARQLRADARAEAQSAARDAITPLVEDRQSRAAKENFMAIAATRDASGEFLFKDPATHAFLLDAWHALPTALQASPEVGEVVLNQALGQIARQRRPQAAAQPGREPALSETVTNRQPSAYTMSALERKLADEANISHKDFEAVAKTYVKGQPNSLE